MKQHRRTLILFIFVLATLGCRPLTTTAETTAVQQNVSLQVAMIPSQDSAEHAKRVEALSHYLESELNVPVEIEIADSYETAVSFLVNGNVNMAYLGPFAYVKARAQNQRLEPVAAPIEKETGRPWYTSVIVVRNDSGINSIEDLQGKRFSFVSQSSNSGFLAPSAYLISMGTTPDRDFASVAYAGSHNKNIEALLSGDADAISINSPTFFKAQNTGQLPTDTYKMLWESEPLPNAPIVINSELPDALKIELRKALIGAPEGLVDGRGVESAGYTLVQDSDYDPIRNLQEILALE
ncbi:MAG: phosphate/phosphite/phosphonate ABC transporter substrate-binding protein [Chloroflexota bacterium]